jgi:hypothetical protein
MKLTWSFDKTCHRGAIQILCVSDTPNSTNLVFADQALASST